MKHVGVREFRDRATQYLAGGDVLVIERHGRPVGYYIPVAPGTEEEVRQTLARLNESIERVLEETGMTEEELSAAFDLTQRG